MTTRYAALEEVAGLAEAMPDRFLECRDMGHNWRRYTADLTTVEGGSVYERTLRCSRCRTLRKQTLSLTGTILSTSYDYADGYQLEGVGRIIGDGRDALRLASITRDLKHQHGNGKSRRR